MSRDSWDILVPVLLVVSMLVLVWIVHIMIEDNKKLGIIEERWRIIKEQQIQHMEMGQDGLLCPHVRWAYQDMQQRITKGHPLEAKPEITCLGGE